MKTISMNKSMLLTVVLTACLCVPLFAQTSQDTYTETDAARLAGMLGRGSTHLKVSGSMTPEIFEAMRTELQKREGDLVYLDLSGATGITQISSFRGCTRLAGIVLPKTVEDIGSFANCINLKQITIPEGVKNVSGSSFSQCASLKEVSLPSTVIQIGGSAFFGCTSLEKINFPGKLKEIGSAAFGRCENLTEVHFPESLTNIGEMAFRGCEKLVTVTLPKHLEILGDRAFFECIGIADVTISSDLPEEFLQYPFYGCPNIKKITVAEGVKEVPADYFIIAEISTRDIIDDYITYYHYITPEIIVFPSTLTVLPNFKDKYETSPAHQYTVTTVYIHAKTPPRASENSFPVKTIKNIYVPKASIKTYEDAWFNYEYTFDGQIKPMP